MFATAAGLAGFGALFAATTSKVDASPLTLLSRNNGADHSQCSDLWKSAPAHLADLTVNLAEYVPAGSTINYTATEPYVSVGVDVGPFCRFSANITTSSKSSVRFEVWLPDEDKWNGNQVFIGNGGDSGYVNYGYMQVPLGKYGFAVASTNTGHDGGSGDGTFAISNPESQYDFGYRAVHLSTVYAKTIVDLYYGKKAKLSYWSGCSSGGKQGLKGIQMFPEDYDAALVGAPAWDWVHLNAWTYYVNAIINNPNATGYIAPPAWTNIHAEVLLQCDKLDGVADGVVTDPGACFLDYTKFGCGSGSDTAIFNSSSCLNDAQLTTLQSVYKNWTDPSTGNLIFPAFNHGSEFGFGGTVTGSPYGPAPSFFNYQVLNKTEVIYPINFPALLVNGSYPTEAQLIDLMNIGLRTDPGMTTAGNPDLSPFFKRGGKLLHYVGGADPLIPTNTSHVYYEKVKAKLGDVSDSYLFYEVAGMGHCSGGPGAYNAGFAYQNVVQANGGMGTSQSAKFDPKYDALLALRAWREKGEKPGAIIGSAYVNDTITSGVAYERPICVWPAYPKYQGGDWKQASSYKCEKP